MKPERRFRVNRVLPFLKTLKNSTYYAIQQVAIRGDADYILNCRGKFVWLELKKDQFEKPSPLQRHKAHEVERVGGVAFCAYPENWDEIKQHLSKMDRGESNGKSEEVSSKN
jgi:hypothetical protein